MLYEKNALGKLVEQSHGKFMYPGKEAARIWVTLNLAQRSTFRAIELALKNQGLCSLNQYDVLWELEKSKVGLRPFELGKILLFEQSNLSRLLQKMITEGLVAQQRSKKDGRGKLLSITDKGLQVRKDAWNVYGPKIQEIFGDLADNDNAADLFELLRSVFDNQDCG